MDLPRNVTLDPATLPTLESRPHSRFPWLVLPVRGTGHRLAGAEYRDPECICLVTTCTRDRLPVFSRHEAATLAKAALLEQVARTNCRLFAYAIMPDHVHWVLAPGTSGLSVSEIVGRWKSYVAYRLRALGMAASPWQRGFHDRILRTAEKTNRGFLTVIAYVLENPVRQGLVSRWEDYPYSGCLVTLHA